MYGDRRNRDQPHGARSRLPAVAATRRALLTVSLLTGVVAAQQPPATTAAPSASSASSASATPPPDSVSLKILVIDLAGLPVAKADIRIEPMRLAVTANDSGLASTRVVRKDLVIVTRSIGFRPVVTRWRAGEAVDGRILVQLPRLAYELEAVEVRARGARGRPPSDPWSMDEFWRRRARGQGRTFTRDELEKWGGLRGALATVPGARIRTDVFGLVTDVRFGRCSGAPSVWYLDGFQVMGGMESVMLSDRDIEAVEVYRGSSELPPEALGIACSAVFLWSRRSP